MRKLVRRKIREIKGCFRKIFNLVIFAYPPFNKDRVGNSTSGAYASISPEQGIG
jgi:hypothetical protein